MKIKKSVTLPRKNLFITSKVSNIYRICQKNMTWKNCWLEIYCACANGLRWCVIQVPKTAFGFSITQNIVKKRVIEIGYPSRNFGIFFSRRKSYQSSDWFPFVGSVTLPRKNLFITSKVSNIYRICQKNMTWKNCWLEIYCACANGLRYISTSCDDYFSLAEKAINQVIDSHLSGCFSNWHQYLNFLGKNKVLAVN
jgi:REP element-mobilizing transposase RayT